jgi:hypothetical protein
MYADFTPLPFLSPPLLFPPLGGEGKGAAFFTGRGLKIPFLRNTSLSLQEREVGWERFVELTFF